VGLHVVLPPAGDGVRYVVVGMDRAFNYASLHTAMSAILSGAEFIASNRDPTFPVENGLLPGGGTIVAAIESAVGFAPLLIGKPETLMVELVLADVECQPAQALIVGDRLDTDIKTGRAAGLHTALVLTGISSADDVRRAPEGMKPDWVLETLAQLPPLIEERIL
jgi:HAD superfamily hydrolase (TIGR01450 family)